MLAIEYYYHCETAEHFEIKVTGSKGKEYTVTWGRMPRNHPCEHDWSCECEGYKFRKTCKHIKEAEKHHCGWYQFSDGGEPVDDKCPNCGGDIKSQGHGV